jgi:predicted amidohydrolase
MRVALAQTAPVFGDVAANVAVAEAWIGGAREAGADLVVFPELSLTGYAVTAIAAEVAMSADDAILGRLAERAGEMSAVVGFVERGEDGYVYNSAAYLAGGSILHVQRKTHLPNYSRWVEGNCFAPGEQLRAFPTSHGTAAVLVCHDAWQPALALLAALDGAQLLIVPACSGAAAGPGETEELALDWATLLNHHARFAQVHVAFANRVGDEGDARFWGGSCVLDPFGAVLAAGPRDVPAMVLAELDPTAVERRRDEIPLVTRVRLDLLSREFGRLGRDLPDR